jgi:hypothetical protein
MMGCWVILIHGAPLLVLPVLPLSGWLNLAVISAALFSLVRSWRLQVRRHHPEAVRSMDWGEGKHCLLGLYSGRQEEVSLCTRAFILPWLVILNFRNRRQYSRYLVLLPDMLDEATYRRLRVRMKLEINQQ